MLAKSGSETKKSGYGFTKILANLQNFFIFIRYRYLVFKIFFYLEPEPEPDKSIDSATLNQLEIYSYKTLRKTTQSV